MLSLMAQKVPSPPSGDRAHLEERAPPPPPPHHHTHTHTHTHPHTHTHTHTNTHTHTRARAQMKKLSPQKIYYFEKK